MQKKFTVKISSLNNLWFISKCYILSLRKLIFEQPCNKSIEDPMQSHRPPEVKCMCVHIKKNKCIYFNHIQWDACLHLLVTMIKTMDNSSIAALPFSFGRADLGRRSLRTRRRRRLALTATVERETSPPRQLKPVTNRRKCKFMSSYLPWENGLIYFSFLAYLEGCMELHWSNPNPKRTSSGPKIPAADQLEGGDFLGQGTPLRFQITWTL